VFAGKTVSICALSETTESRRPLRNPQTFPILSLLTSLIPSARSCSPTHAARALSPNGGAGMRASSICQRANSASWSRNHRSADCTSGKAANRGISFGTGEDCSAVKRRATWLMEWFILQPIASQSVQTYVGCPTLLALFARGWGFLLFVPHVHSGRSNDSATWVISLHLTL
jgi:hypothetical protein